MSAPAPAKKVAQAKTQMQRVRVTLTSLNVPNIEKVSATLVESAKKKGFTVRGPRRMPTKHLRLTTRKTPCGEGSKTWDRFTMNIHKRVIDIECAAESVKDITSISIEPGVDIELSVTKMKAKAAPKEK